MELLELGGGYHGGRELRKKWEVKKKQGATEVGAWKDKMQNMWGGVDK